MLVQLIVLVLAAPAAYETPTRWDDDDLDQVDLLRPPDAGGHARVGPLPDPSGVAVVLSLDRQP